MEKKQLAPNGRQRLHLLGRLRKAAKWAVLFEHLCRCKGDSRTSLEAEAYASYIRGTLLFEQDRDWKSALLNFQSSRTIYEELHKYGSLEDQILCRERVDELEPSIRYCLHKLGKSDLKTSELLHVNEMESPALDLLKVKLEAVMADERSRQAIAMTEFHWLGHTFPVSNAKTRVAILKAQELEKNLKRPAADSLIADKKLSIFDNIFAAYHDARGHIRDDLASAGNADDVKDILNGLDKAVSAVLGERTIERNQLLISVARGKMSKCLDDKSDKGTKPEEIVHLYSLLLQSVADLSDLVQSGRNKKQEEVEFIENLECKSLYFSACRYFYLARSYGIVGKRAEAYVLYGRARSYADEALQKFQSLGRDDEMVMEIVKLRDECRTSRCIEHAAGILEELKVPENLSKNLSELSLTAAHKDDKYLLEKLNAFEPAVYQMNGRAVSRICQMPPPYRAISRNPIVLDLAHSCIEFPSLENRIKKYKKGLISRFWG